MSSSQSNLLESDLLLISFQTRCVSFDCLRGDEVVRLLTVLVKLLAWNSLISIKEYRGSIEHCFRQNHQTWKHIKKECLSTLTMGGGQTFGYSQCLQDLWQYHIILTIEKSKEISENFAVQLKNKDIYAQVYQFFSPYFAINSILIRTANLISISCEDDLCTV